MQSCVASVYFSIFVFVNLFLCLEYTSFSHFSKFILIFFFSNPNSKLISFRNRFLTSSWRHFLYSHNTWFLFLPTLYSYLFFLYLPASLNWVPQKQLFLIICIFFLLLIQCWTWSGSNEIKGRKSWTWIFIISEHIPPESELMPWVQSYNVFSLCDNT